MISIVIPVYNTPIDFIKECVNSIHSQTFKDYEVILVNDGSNEEVSGFLKTLVKDNWYLFEKKKEGISKALNLGIQKSKHDLICRMDADDIMLPERLEKQFQYFQKNNLDILGGQMELFGESSSITSHPVDIPTDIMRYKDWFMNHPTVMFKKDSITKVGGYNPEFDGTEDLELWCRSLANGLTIKNLTDIIVRHRRHGDNATLRNNLNEILQKNFQLRNYYLNIIYNK
jgi:glycosyltransferase involved in cell wall biosynthesis